MTERQDNTRQFEFNAIYVIDSLSPAEFQTAEELYENIIRRRLTAIDFVTGYHIRLNTRDELFSLLKEIKDRVLRDGQYPFLHFEVHGSPDGLVLSNNESIAWQELAERLRAINMATKNNLFVSLATCHGAYIVGEVRPSQPCPFFACVAPWEKVSADDVLESFEAFFDSILSEPVPERIDFKVAVGLLNLANGRAWRYYHYNAELLFERIFDQYDQTLLKGRAYTERVEMLVQRAYLKFNRRRSKNNIRHEVKERLIRDRHTHKEQMKRKFLMLMDEEDTFPS